MRVRALLLAGLWFAHLAAFAQSTSPTTSFQPHVPPAPTTAALERYALMPVSEAAGTPGVTVPLYQVRSGTLSVPVTLSYHASGVRVSDAASWAGLGWSLQAGGAITRIVRGAPDEGPEGFEEHADALPPLSIRIATHDNLLSRVAKNQLDYQPDLYTFTALGQSGSFLLGNDKQFHALPLQPLRIQRVGEAFLLTDAGGTRYHFQSAEYMSVPGKAGGRYQSAWYLDQVVSANRADTIRFTYETTAVQQEALSQQQTFFSALVHDDYSRLSSPPSEGFTETRSSSTLSSLKLRHIYFRGGRLDVGMEPGRLDVAGDVRLASVTVLSAGREDTLQHVRLFHSYFGAPRTGDDARLRLDSVRTHAPGLHYPAFVFTYNPVALPNRLTGARDHWGYYNGAVLPTSTKGTPLLIPATLVERYFGASPRLYPGADREPHPAFGQAGLLTLIRYPTGGTQRMVYEPNTVARPYLLPTPQTIISLQEQGPGEGDEALCRTSSQTFQVPELLPTGTYRFYASQPLTTDGRGHHKAIFTITDVTPEHTPALIKQVSTQFGTNTTWSDENVIKWVQGHTYQVQLQVCGSASARLTLTHQSGQQQYGRRNELAGGVRIRELHLRASAQSPATIKRYYYQAPGSSLSSGYLLGQETPVYSRRQITRVPGKNTCTDCSVTGTPPLPVDIVYTTLSANSYSELSGSDRIIGYKVVQVVDSAATGARAGRTVSWYKDRPDGGGGWNPPVPQLNYGWQRDQLLRQDLYTTEAGEEKLVSHLENEYSTLMDSVQIVGFAAGVDATILADPYNTAVEQGVYAYSWSHTRQAIGWQYLTRTRQYRYSQATPTAFQLTTTSYQYGNHRHQQPTRVETTLSDGNRQQQRTRYAADYDTTQVSGSPALAIREWLRSHQLSQVVEQTTLRIRGTDTLVTQGSLLVPRRLAPGVVVADQQLALHLAAPVALPQFSFSSLRQGTLTYAAAYQPTLVVDRYDAQARITQTHVPHGASTSYLWNTLTGQPLAQGNALTLDQVAVSSFEPGAAGNWEFAEAGRVPGGLTGE